MTEVLALALGIAIGAVGAALAVRPRLDTLRTELRDARADAAARDGALDAVATELAEARRESERLGKALAEDNAGLRRRIDELADEILRRAT